MTRLMSEFFFVLHLLGDMKLTTNLELSTSAENTIFYARFELVTFRILVVVPHKKASFILFNQFLFFDFCFFDIVFSNLTTGLNHVRSQVAFA
jgi:hypothetical protein